MNKPKSILKIAAFAFFCFSIQMFKSQVGVNTITPVATLDIKATGANDSTKAEGIIAPNLTREQLIAKDAQYTTDLNGAIVCVTDLSGTTTTKTANITKIGYYYFNGSTSKWDPIGGQPEPWLIQNSTNESTSNTDNIYQMGNVAIGAITSDSDNFYVEGTSHFKGQLTLDYRTAQSNSRALVIDDSTGLVGTAATTPALIFYAQKRESQQISGTDLTNLNSNLPVVVKWNTEPISDTNFTDEESDIVTNNLNVTFDSATNEFVFGDNSDGTYEISGYVNYIARATSNATAALNVIVQLKKYGSTTWVSLAGARSMLTNSAYAQTVIISPAARDFKGGDRIRLVVSNPGVAANHGGGGAAGLLLPNGLKYLASLKISSL